MAAEGDREILARLNGAGAAIDVAIFTDKNSLVLGTYDLMRAGTLAVNDRTDSRVDGMPFGGVGAAGLRREGVRSAIEGMRNELCSR